MSDVQSVVWEKRIVPVSELRLVPELQMRLDPKDEGDYLSDLTEAEGKWVFPRIKCCLIRNRLYVVDGFTRTRAALLYAERVENPDYPVKIIVRESTKKEAFIESLGSNAEHGYRRSNADKRHVVKQALAKLRGYSCEDIAELCKVSAPFVYRIRASLAEPETKEPTKEQAAKAGAEHNKNAAADKLADQQAAAETALSKQLGTCPVCKGKKWETRDDGYYCLGCKHKHGEPAGLSGDEDEPHTNGKPQTNGKASKATAAKPASKAVDPANMVDLRLDAIDKASAHFGIAVRDFDDLGWYAALKPHLKAIQIHINEEKRKCRKK